MYSQFFYFSRLRTIHPRETFPHFECTNNCPILKLWNVNLRGETSIFSMHHQNSKEEHASCFARFLSSKVTNCGAHFVNLIIRRRLIGHERTDGSTLWQLECRVCGACAGSQQRCLVGLFVVEHISRSQCAIPV